MVDQGMQMGPSGPGTGQSIGQQISGMQNSQNQGSGNNEGPSEFAQIANMVSDLDRRLRVLEERYGNLRKKVQLTDQNLIESDRSFGKELRRFNDDILEMKRSTADFDEKVMMLDGEMSNIAQKTDLKVIEKYLAMWSPGMFVTRKELKEYLKNNRIRLADEPEQDDDEQ